jgi:adenylate cyclase
LIDATTNKHLWAQRYDRGIEDLFAVQDEVVRSVVTSLAYRVEDTETLARSRKPPRNWAAYDYVLKARERMIYGESWLPVEGFLRRAIELDSSIPEAHSLLVYVLIEKFIEEGSQAYLDEALGLARTAITLNANGSGPHVAMAFLSLIMGRLDLSDVHGRRAIELNPNNIQARIHRAEWLTICGRCEEALAALGQIGEMVPHAADFLWAARGMALFQLRRYQEVVETLGRWIKPDSVVWAHAIAALILLGQPDEARRQLAAMTKANPGTTIAKILRYAPYQHREMRDHLADALRKAGLPD